MRNSKLVVVWLVAFACGGKEPDDTTETPTIPGTTVPTTDDTDPPGTTSSVVTVLVDAATGGTVEAYGAVLSVPPGALAADTEITVSVGPASGAPDAASVVGQLFDFGPDGTVFSVPATLTLPAEATLASDERLVVSWLDGASWTDLPSTAGVGTASGEVAHFTSFAARAILSATDLGVCAPMAGCGGDLTGTWVPYQTCIMSAGEVPFGCEVPFVNTYTNMTGSRTWSADGTFRGDGGDGSGTLDSEHTIPAACLPAGLTDCVDVYASLPFATDYVCSGDVAVSCTCTSGPYPAYGSSGSGTWAVAGAELTETVPGEVGTIDNLYVYCVDGDTLTLWDGDEPETYTRQ